MRICFVARFALALLFAIASLPALADAAFEVRLKNLE